MELACLSQGFPVTLIGIGYLRTHLMYRISPACTVSAPFLVFDPAGAQPAA